MQRTLHGTFNKYLKKGYVHAYEIVPKLRKLKDGNDILSGIDNQ